MPIIRLDPDSPMGRQLQQVQTIFYAVVAVPLLLFLMMYLNASQPEYRPYMSLESAVAVHIGVWGIVLALSIWAMASFSRKNKEFTVAAPLEGKFTAYTRHSRQLHLFLGLLMMLPVAAIWATGLLFYSIMFLLLLILMASVRPTVEHFITSFRLSKEEQAQLVRLS